MKIFVQKARCAFFCMSLNMSNVEMRYTTPVFSENIL